MSHGQRATVIRYQLPAVLALQIAAAIGIAASLQNPARFRRLAEFCAAFVLAVSGLVSVSQYKSAGAAWWNKNSAEDILPAAAIINRQSSPLVVSSVQVEYVYDIFALAHPLADHVRRHRQDDVPLLELRPGPRRAARLRPAPRPVRIREIVPGRLDRAPHRRPERRPVASIASSHRPSSLSRAPKLWARRASSILCA